MLLFLFSLSVAVNPEAVCPGSELVSNCEVHKGLVRADGDGCQIAAICNMQNGTEEYEIAICPDIGIVANLTILVLGGVSEAVDDAQSIAICPEGWVVTYCEVQTGLVHTKSDGAHVNLSDPHVCVAFNGFHGPGVIARAFCSRNGNVTDPCNDDGHKKLKFLNLHDRGPNPSVCCPFGYEQILCNARSPWVGYLTGKGVNQNGVIPNNQSCAVSGCNDDYWCEITAVCRIREDAKACEEEEVEIVGDKSGAADDAPSIAICPLCYVVTYCEVQTGLVAKESDGAKVTSSDPNVCTAYNAGTGNGVIARALCSRNETVTDPCNNEGPDIPKFLNLNSKGEDPSASCPLGYQQILCNAYSPWWSQLVNKGVNENGVIPNDLACAVSGCKSYCEVTAVCKILDYDDYENHVC
jgi:hypothetical protein